MELRATQPDPRQCAMLVAYLLATKQEAKQKVGMREGARKTEVTRARLSELTIRRLFGRQRITPEFLIEVQEWLLRAGWVLFFAGTTYAVVRIDVVAGWGRISSKRIRDELAKVGRGQFSFDPLEQFLLGPDSLGDDRE